MARSKNSPTTAVDSIRHSETRKNIPTNELRDFLVEYEANPSVDFDVLPLLLAEKFLSSPETTPADLPRLHHAGPCLWPHRSSATIRTGWW